ncbi:peptide chain release factor N(5)-glutamine methyltransferase [Edaphobacter bradus]|uniref:peptide chain release factor N(5)-glutamine methyltransferase n=1 Tax=Edaphobacter bradus TaxID=2259016 RepID=UPI0021DF7C0A|nr:peptide chain release factor N(5)-glutamine methyltransferase [Edaphobacter bradus]
MNLRQALDLASTQLAGRRPAVDRQQRASRDAELLLLHALKISRATLLAHPDRQLSTEELAQYQQSIQRRKQNEPVQYITGQQQFFGLDLHVTGAVLVPRPETEHLVEAVLLHMPSDRPVTIADVGTGSGAIALALAAQLPHAQLTALDSSPAALDIARINAKTNHLEDRIRFLESDLLSALPADASFDAIVSNPPYIPNADRATLDPEVRDFEPATALFAGEDGLDVYRRLIPQAHAALRPSGLLAMEIGHGQRNAIAALLADWHGVTFVNDLQGIPRVALARRPS